jgi:polysaccharide chain length determinant protein (PEP-CTERM system associated)
VTQETFEEQPQEKLDWAKYWTLAQRRYWLFMVPFFFAWAAVWSVSWLLPPVYRSSTLIFVQPKSNYLVTGNAAPSDLQSRLDTISQQVTSRTNLLHIISTLNLYAEQRASSKWTDDDLVERMRKNIDIEVDRSSSDKELSSFKIYFSSPSPDIAQQVTTELTNSLITGTIENQNSDLERQNKVLDSELEDERLKLTNLEEKLRNFQDQHMGELPGQLQSNIQILSGLQTQLQGEQDALGRAKQQKEYYESLIGQYNSMGAPTGKPGETPGGLPAIDQELSRERAQLADLQSIYTDQHPDVRKLKEQIARTEKMKQQLLTQLKNKTDESADPSEAAALPASGPLMELRSQLKANQLEIANRQRAVDNLQAQIASYQGRLNSTPVREQQLADLNRDHEQIKSYYNQLLDRKNQAGLAQKVNREQQGDSFTMQDPPSRPTKPYSPNRFKLSLIGLFVGFSVGVVVAGGAEFLDDRVYDEETFKKLVPAEVLVEIPTLRTADEERELQSKFVYSLCALGLIGLVVLAGTAISFLRG